MKAELDAELINLMEAYDACQDEALRTQSIENFRKIGGSFTEQTAFSISAIDIAKAQGTFDNSTAFQGDASQINSRNQFNSSNLHRFGGTQQTILIGACCA